MQRVSAAEGREGTGWLEYGWLGVSGRGLRSSEYGGRRREAVSYEGRAKVQRWKSGKVRCGGGEEYRVLGRVRRTEERQCKGAKEGGRGIRTKGRGAALPRPPRVGGQGGALPLPASVARERGRLGWHAVPTLPDSWDCEDGVWPLIGDTDSLYYKYR